MLSFLAEALIRPSSMAASRKYFTAERSRSFSVAAGTVVASQVTFSFRIRKSVNAGPVSSCMVLPER